MNFAAAAGVWVDRWAGLVDVCVIDGCSVDAAGGRSGVLRMGVGVGGVGLCCGLFVGGLGHR